MAGSGAALRNSLHGRRVLVVEDEYFVADDLARALTRAGAKVVGPAADPDAALALLREHNDIDGAVLDINLKGDTDYSVADALQARGVPFCFATGYDAAALPGRYQDVPRWQKPFDTAKLVRSIAAMVSQQ